MSGDGKPAAKSKNPTRVIRVEGFEVGMPDPVDGDFVEQPLLFNGRPLFFRRRLGPDSDPMIMWYCPNPNGPSKKGLWMINNKTQFDTPEPTAKAVSKSLAESPELCETWMAYDPKRAKFVSSNLQVKNLTATQIRLTSPEKMKVHGRAGYNRAMNGTYIRGRKPHCGKSYYRHEDNDFTIRWFESKWVVDWRGLHNDNIGAAVCKEDVPEPWMCTIPWRIYDGKARDKKWKFDPLVKMEPIKPMEAAYVAATTHE